jgi:hypothetical protein
MMGGGAAETVRARPVKRNDSVDGEHGRPRGRKSTPEEPTSASASRDYGGSGYRGCHAGAYVDILGGCSMLREKKMPMTITIDLPRELERELSEAAARLGLPLAEYAVQILTANSGSPSDAAPRLSGAELVEYWAREGIIGSRPDIDDPVAFARELRNQAQNRTLD